MIRKARREDAQAISEVRRASWRTTYKGIIDQSVLDRLDAEKWAEGWAQRFDLGTLHNFVAEENGEVAGFAIAGAERDKKYPNHPYELYAIYILQEHQGKGIGRKLVSHVVEAFAEAGDNGMIVWALQENPYCSFYEKLGGVPIDHQPLVINERSYEENAYAWDSLRDIKV